MNTNSVAMFILNLDDVILATYIFNLTLVVLYELHKSGFACKIVFMSNSVMEVKRIHVFIKKKGIKIISIFMKKWIKKYFFLEKNFPDEVKMII
jgi:hypothetical protein